MIESAGLLILYDNKILLGHPTKKKSIMGTYSIPKGKLEKGETHIQAAIRETKEEIGIDINIDIIDKTPHIINYTNSRNIIYKRLTYFIVKLEEKIEIDKKKLSKIEIDKASYFDKYDATMRIFWRFGEMLDYLK